MQDDPNYDPYTSPDSAPSPPPLPLGKTAWNAWWTWLWAIVLFVVWQVVMTIGIFVALLINGDLSGKPDSKSLSAAAESLSMDGDVLGLVAFSAIFAICPACWFLGQFRPGWTGWEYLGEARVKWWKWPLWGFATIACTVLFSLVAPFLGIPEKDPSMAQMASSTQYPIFLYLGVGIGAPLVEEFIFRGVLFRGWRESRLGFPGTLLLTSFCWAVLHVQYPIATIGYIFVLGLVLGIAREKTGSLWVPVWMHALNNGLATLSMLNY